MRVLCLHPNASSAAQLHSLLSQLEERLWTKHGIELVFIDAPLLDVPSTTSTDSNNVDDRALEESQFPRRRWYIKESITNKSLLPPSDESQDTNNKEKPNTNATIQYSGLDASLLHITQIWSRGGANNSNKTDNNTGIEQCLPFQGILGVQQGASVAAMLPLLTTACNDNEEEAKCLLEGLQFVILVDGADIMSQDESEDCIDGSACQEMNKENSTNEKEEEDWYVGPNGIESLHVIAETSQNNNNNDTDTINKRNSELLAKRYGPNANVQYYKPSKKKSSSSTQQNSNSTKLSSPSLHNILGKYLVQQKNKFQSNPQQRALLQIQHQLSHVEQVASVMITEEVKRNPPRCLMAMIGPAAATSTTGHSDQSEDGENNESNNNGNGETEANPAVKAVVGKTVGAWQGSGRVPGEQGGGAPCPETFLLRQEDRKNNALVESA